MYLHIGGNQMIDIRQLVAIFKVHPHKSYKSNPVEAYYKPVIHISDKERTRAFVVTEGCVYATPITVETIVERYKRLFVQQDLLRRALQK